CDAGITIENLGSLDVVLKGGDGKDNLQFQFQGKVGSLSIMDVTLDGQNGDDTVTADIALDKDSSGSVNAKVLGGEGNDTLALYLSNQGTGAVQAQIDGGPGYDTATKTLNSNITDSNCEVVLYYFDLSQLHV